MAAGAVHDAKTDDGEAPEAETPGAPGTPAGGGDVVRTTESAGPGPTLFAASTVTVYAVDGFRPEKVCDRTPAPATNVWPPGDTDSRYSVIAEPFAAAAVHDTATDDDVTAPPDTTGGPGTSAAAAVDNVVDPAEPGPTAFTATTDTVYGVDGLRPVNVCDNSPAPFVAT